MFVVGIDIGYSNLKLTFGDGGMPEQMIMPAGAAPKEFISQSVAGAAQKNIKVMVGEQEYIAGVDQSSIDGWERVLSNEYPFSDDYMALFRAALMCTNQTVIDRVVTGLPVSQHADEALRGRLKEHLKGAHQVGKGRTINVRDVLVVPQPVGAYIDYLSQCEDPRIVEKSRVLVIDPGFFSVDYCAIDRGNFDKTSSGSSQEAMSVLLEETGKLIAADHGRPHSLSDLENAARGDREVPVFGKMINIDPYMTIAAGNVAERVMRSVKQNLRRSKVQGADFTLMAGGGADHYKDAAQKIMEGSQVVTAKKPVGSNSMGFYLMGRG